MATMINICSSKNKTDPDAYFRYQMPAIITKVEGRGNGIKTVMVNMGDVAKALHCRPEYPTKFLGMELGALSIFEPRTDKTPERAVVNGKHETADVQRLIGKFVELFILCPRCHLPEIKMTVEGEGKKAKIMIDCASCGFNGKLPTDHKLCSFIIANPPAKVQTNVHESKEEGMDGEGVEKKVNEIQNLRSANEDNWFTDTSEIAQRARRNAEFAEISEEERARLKAIEEIKAQAKAMGTPDAPAVQLKIFMVGRNRSIDEILGELRRLQLARSLDDSQKIKVLLEAIIEPDSKTIHEQFGKHAALFRRITRDKFGGMDKVNGTLLINCIEDFIGEIHPNLANRAPLILSELYQKDVLDEDTILSWGSSPPESSWFVKREAAALIRAKAKPFLDWLETADEDEDEDEDGEDAQNPEE